MNKRKRKINPNKTLLSLSLVIIAGLAFGLLAHSLNISFPEIKNAALEPFSEARAQISALYLSNIHITSLTSTSVNIAWETNLFSDSKVEIGETTNYETPCDTCSSTSFVKTHNITIGGLSPGETYHYRVISKTETGETKTSLDRTFATPTSTSDTTAPSVTYMAAEVTGSDADIIVHTSEDSHVTVYYSTDPIVDISDPSLLSANDNAIPHRVLHTIGLSGLTLSTTYYYRVQAIDPAGNSFTTGEFTFTTAGAADYVFTTGVCAGGVPIGGCTAEQYYCDVGTGALVRNCEHCGYLCPTGQTCLPGGVCSTDPTLTDDPYQCNRAECYKNCQGISPVQSCTSDAECPGVPCVDDGVFNSPAPSNCFSTYPRCDANVILKVKRDRECDKWLECGTAIEQTDSKTGQKEEICMDLAACTALGENNQCTSYVDLPKLEATYRTPEEIKDIKWLTGAITAGLDWQYQEGSPIIQGYFPWSAMAEVGEKLEITNGDFEGTITKEVDRGTAADVYGGRGIVQVPRYGISSSDWIKYPDDSNNETALSVVWESKEKKENHILKAEGMTALNQGVTAKIKGGSSTTLKYVLSLKIKSSSADEQKVTLELNSGGEAQNKSIFGVYSLSTGWQKILTPAVPGVGGKDTYLNIYVSGGNSQPFYIDDVKIKPVLERQSGVYLERSCRLYPKEDSPSCEYYDDNGIKHKGWYGYCLERDPRNENICISWWPVDLLYGESNLFGNEEPASYQGRVPLYYCAESKKRIEGPANNKAYCKYSCDYEGTEPSNWDIEICDRENRCSGSNGCNGNNVNCSKLGSGWGALEVLFKENDPRYGIPEDEIKFIEVVPIKDYTTGGWPIFRFIKGTFPYNYAYNGYPSHGSSDDSKKYHYTRVYEEGNQYYIWKAWPNTSNPSPGYMADNKPWGNGVNVVWIDIIFDTNKRLIGYRFAGNNNSTLADVPEGTTGEDGAVYYKLKVNLDSCSKVVQVAKEGGENMANAEKINSKGYKVLDLNYRQNTDFNPFGGTVTLSGEPDSWTTPLFAEAPDLSRGSPYQVRSGKPYACVGDCSKMVCLGGGDKDGDLCNEHSDCYDDQNMEQGVCTGVGTCFPTAKGCTQDSDCPSGEECIGGAANNKGNQSLVLWPGSGNENFAEQRIRRLFVRSYGLWEWSGSDSKYNFIDDSGLPLASSNVNYRWGPPNRRCEKDGKKDIRPPEDFVNNTDYCGIPPKIRNIKLGDGSSNYVKLGPDGGKVKLTFNTFVDREQQPLKNIIIDWGDGEKQRIPFDYKSKDNPSNPHVFSHAYKACLSGDCRYKIKVLIEDNWGWCSGWPGDNLLYYGTCMDLSSEKGEPCQPPSPCPFGTCAYKCYSCNTASSYECSKLKADYGDPVDACQGGVCQDNICQGGQDDGRPCGSLIVDLTE